MRFKQWLENEDQSAQIFYWVGNRWTRKDTGSYDLYGKYITSQNIWVYVDYRRVSVEGAHFNHPQMKKALSILLKQFPSFANKELDFDGHVVGSLAFFLKNKSFHGRKDRLPQFLYHGTSLHRWERIQENGLSPRVVSGSGPVYGAEFDKPSNEILVYLATNIGNTTRFAAREASHDGSSPLILKIDSRGIDYTLLEPDEDADTENWMKSMYGLGTIGYDGIIAPQYIEPLMILKDQNWEKVQPADLEPTDWLGKEFLKKKTGWVNPREI